MRMNVPAANGSKILSTFLLAMNKMKIENENQRKHGKVLCKSLYFQQFQAYLNIPISTYTIYKCLVKRYNVQCCVSDACIFLLDSKEKLKAHVLTNQQRIKKTLFAANQTKSSFVGTKQISKKIHKRRHLNFILKAKRIQASTFLMFAINQTSKYEETKATTGKHIREIVAQNIQAHRIAFE